MTTNIHKDDPDLVLPAAVRAAAKRSDQLFHALRDQTGEESAPAAEEQVTSEGNPELSAAALAEPAEAPAEPPAQEQPRAEPAPQETEQSWEHKYKSLHGRFMRSQEQIKSLTEHSRELAGRIASLESSLATVQTPAASDLAPEENLITEADLNDYGQDFLNVVGKKAKQEIAAVSKAQQARIDQLEQQLKGHVQQTSTERLLIQLDEKLPQWRELNTNETFLAWLGLPDPYSGVIRHDMLSAAYAQGNTSRVLAFFNGFLAEEAAVEPGGAGPDDPGTIVPKVPLKDLAAPGRAKTAASTSVPAEKPLITRAQITAFYAGVNAGKYRGRDAERQRLENMIFEAQREGRIR